jgi:polysaccharide deacetylase family protein (PEP-CTERM system associated)
MNQVPNAEAQVFNALTIDVEEWFHICGIGGLEGLTFERRARGNIDRLLTVLEENQIKATFFVLGSLAETEPGLVADIAAKGHEIASHGYSHYLVNTLTPDAFRDELRRTSDILGRLTGHCPRGFRAPQWSLSRSGTPWAFDILLEEGYHYDSSLNPLPFVGDKAGTRIPWRMKVGQGSIWEVPPLVTPSLIGNLPTGGGWGFRFFPIWMIENSIQNLNSHKAPAVLFLHPRELDPDGPRLKMSRFREFVAYGSRKDAMERLKRLISSFRFITLGEMVKKWESA